MINFGICESKTRVSRIVLSEKRSKITFVNDNNHNIRKIIIDGCFINEGIKCDFLLILPDDTELFVELKGCDVSHAINQLERTIEKTSNNIFEQPKISFIVSTRCPLASAEIQNYKLRFKKKYKSELIIKNSPCKFTI